VLAGVQKTNSTPQSLVTDGCGMGTACACMHEAGCPASRKTPFPCGEVPTQGGSIHDNVLESGSFNQTDQGNLTRRLICTSLTCLTPILDPKLEGHGRILSHSFLSSILWPSRDLNMCSSYSCDANRRMPHEFCGIESDNVLKYMISEAFETAYERATVAKLVIVEAVLCMRCRTKMFSQSRRCLIYRHTRFR